MYGQQLGYRELVSGRSDVYLAFSLVSYKARIRIHFAKNRLARIAAFHSCQLIGV